MTKEIAQYQKKCFCKFNLPNKFGKGEYNLLHPNCPIHGQSYCKYKYSKIRRCIDPTLESRFLILHINSYPNYKNLKALIKKLKSITRKTCRKTRIGFIFHPKLGNYHLHILIQNPDFKLLDSAYEIAHIIPKPKGRKKKFTSLNMLVNCISAKFDNIITCRSSVDNKNSNQPFLWLAYALRKNTGFESDHIFPDRTKPDYGFTRRWTTEYHQQRKNPPSTESGSNELLQSVFIPSNLPLEGSETVSSGVMPPEMGSTPPGGKIGDCYCSGSDKPLAVGFLVVDEMTVVAEQSISTTMSQHRRHRMSWNTLTEHPHCERVPHSVGNHCLRQSCPVPCSVPSVRPTLTSPRPPCSGAKDRTSSPCAYDSS